MFEYSLKGLPHALMHAPDLVKLYGHHGACCTCVGEAGHKLNIKHAAKFARTYGDRNQSQSGMLQYVQRQQLWTAVTNVNTTEMQDDFVPMPTSAEDSGGTQQLIETESMLHKLREPLPHLTAGWSSIRTDNGRPPRMWGATFLSKRLLITRNELITLLRTKLELEDSWSNIVLLATRLHWACYGCVLFSDNDGKGRKVVGISNAMKKRRDFVRLRGIEDNTALGAQVRMYM